MTGPGDVDRDRKCWEFDEEIASLAPSTDADMVGEAGLFEAEDWLLPDVEPLGSWSLDPSVTESFLTGTAVLVEPFPVGVPY